MKTNKQCIGHSLQCILYCLILLLVASSSYAQGLTNNLFTNSSIEGLAFDQPAEPHIKRSRPVTLNLESLKAANPSQTASVELQGTQTPDQDSTIAQATPAVSLSLNLFPDVDLQVTFNDLQRNKSGSMTWTGKVEGNEDSLIILIVKDGVMIGNITVGTTQYQVRYIGNNIHVVHEINQAGFPSEADPDRVEYPPVDPTSDTSFLTLDDALAMDSSVLDGRETKRVIDVMVAYTAAARVRQGSTTAINNLIDLAITETNTGYTNSGINQVLNLVHTVEVVYTESGNIQTDRDRLKNPTDGFMDNVHALRDTYAADLVPLIVDNGGGFCGIAYIMESVSTQFEDSGFCIVADECATGYYSFGHELGHSMGARHDWFVDSTNDSPYTYNHALTNPADGWRTVMAYNNACGGSCTRLLYWSNPDEIYGGDAMGTREGIAQAKDNRKTLANTGFVVANFRVKDTSAEPSEAFTSGAAPNNGNEGIMFDLKAKQQTTIHGFSTVFDSAGIVDRVEIYYKVGSYSGSDTDPSAWNLVGSATGFTVQAPPAQTHIPIDLDITIPAGQTYAFYITTPSAALYLRYMSGSSEGAIYASNDSLELMEGRGINYPFNTPNVPRVFAGTIYHSITPTPTALNTVSPNNQQDGIMFDIKAKKTITIQAFSTYIGQGISGKMEIWYRQGTHVGHETVAADWTLLGSVDNVIGSNVFNSPPFVQNRIPIKLDLEIPAGEVYAFYVTTIAASPYMDYRSGTTRGSVSAANSDMEVLEGTGKAYPFDNNYIPRVFAGTIYYTSGGFPWPMFLPAIIINKTN